MGTERAEKHGSDHFQLAQSFCLSGQLNGFLSNTHYPSLQNKQKLKTADMCWYHHLPLFFLQSMKEMSNGKKTTYGFYIKTKKQAKLTVSTSYPKRYLQDQ